MLYKNGQLIVGAKIDVEPHSFLTFLQAIAGYIPSSELLYSWIVKYIELNWLLKSLLKHI